MLHYAACLSSALARRPELDVCVVVPNSADTSLFSNTVKVNAVDIPDRLSISAVLKMLCGISFLILYRAISETRPDVVVFNSSHPLLLVIAPLLARRIKTAAIVHDAVSHPGADENFRKSLERRATATSVRRAFVHRGIIREQLLEAYPNIQPASVLISPHGDYDFFAEFDGAEQQEPSTLLFFGRLSYYKGLTYLIQAVDLIREQIPGLRVVIAGSGELESDVSQAVNDPVYEVHNRFIQDQEVGSFFRRATVVVLPYIEASESGVVKVAEAFTRSVITTRVGGLPEAVQHGVTGLIVEPENAQELADAILKLMTDKSLRESFEEQIRENNNQRPGWNEAAEIMATTFRELVGEDDIESGDR